MTRWPTWRGRRACPTRPSSESPVAAAVNVPEMDENNFGFLFDVDPLSSGTPTVYDLVGDEKIDIYDNDWLS